MQRLPASLGGAVQEVAQCEALFADGLFTCAGFTLLSFPFPSEQLLVP